MGKKQGGISMLQGQNFLKETDFTAEELTYLIDFSIHLKELKKKNIPHRYLERQNICLIFEKTSTRTRSAFSVAASDLGASVEYFGMTDIQMGNKESVEDTAIVMGSMFDGIEFRGFKQTDVETLGKYAGVPVWNGLTDEFHPTQMIADFMTIKETYGRLEGLNLVYAGDGRNNVANSLMITAAILGVNIAIAAPKELFPAEDLVKQAQAYAEESGAVIRLEEDIQKACQNAHAIYTDVWISMGEEDLMEERINQLKGYQVTAELFEEADDQAIFLHCLPAYHDLKTSNGVYFKEEFGLEEMEVSDEVFRAPYAKQFQQAENRMHSIKAIMAATNGHLFVP